MNKKVFYGFLIALIAVSFLSLRWYKQEYGAESKEKISECSCPSLDELLIQEMPEASMKLEAPITRERKDIVLSSEKSVIQEDGREGVRIILRYDNKGTLLKRANTYGLTTNKASSQVPYYFTLNGAGERLYFTRDESFRKFLFDIGGRGILNKAQGEVVVRLASGSRFELIEY